MVAVTQLVSSGLSPIAGSDDPCLWLTVVLNILFWIFLILAIVGVFVPEKPDQPFIARGRWVFVLILLGILGLKVFGFPS